MPLITFSRESNSLSAAPALIGSEGTCKMQAIFVRIRDKIVQEPSETPFRNALHQTYWDGSGYNVVTCWLHCLQYWGEDARCASCHPVDHRFTSCVSLALHFQRYIVIIIS